MAPCTRSIPTGRGLRGIAFRWRRCRARTIFLRKWVTSIRSGSNSGNIQVGFAGQSGFGTIKPEALEQSNVDLASELTSMIKSQRGYTANSKVFQTGADLLDVLVNLKR